MGKKQLIFAENARQNLLTGISVLARTVGPTLGPMGGNVTVDGRSRGGTVRYDPPQIVAQGQHIIRDLELKNKFHNLGVKILKEAAQKTDDLVGDGTSTTVFLSHALISEGIKCIAAGAHPMIVRRGMERAVDAASQALREMAIPIRSTGDIGKVLGSTSGSPEIAEALQWAIDEVGPDGMILVERHSKTLGIIVECVHGFHYERGYLSSYFVTDPDEGAVSLEQPYILVTDEEINSGDQLMPLLDELRHLPNPNLLLIAPEVKDTVLGLLITNHHRGIIHSVAVRPPAAGDARRQMMEDLCFFTGATLISRISGYTLSKATVAHLGRAESSYVTSDNTTIVGGQGDSNLLKTRITELKTLLSATTHFADRQKIERRVAQLAGGIARIRVGSGDSSRNGQQD